MISSRIFLAAVGFTYLYLACWCSLMPMQTSKLVGFDLVSGSGQSEFLVIYGGLEMALAIVFLSPLIRSRLISNSLITCLIVHGCLAVFRSVSFVLYSGIQPMTRQLAFFEWLFFIGAAGALWRERRQLRIRHSTADRSPAN